MKITKFMISRNATQTAAVSVHNLLKTDLGAFMKLLLFDLDDTLLRSDKTISAHSLQTLTRCREKGLLLGIATSRSAQNAKAFIEMLAPEVVISSGGALVQYQGEIVSCSEFSAREVRRFISLAKDICGNCEITVDTLCVHYWNRELDPAVDGADWGESIYSDFSDFADPALKICVEISEESLKNRLVSSFGECDVIRFAGTDWYKFTKPNTTKETAIINLCPAIGITPMDIIAFGDDIPDIGMLRLCGIGVAMENALTEVKAAADVVIGSNDSEAIAEYLERTILTQ